MTCNAISKFLLLPSVGLKEWKDSTDSKIVAVVAYILLTLLAPFTLLGMALRSNSPAPQPESQPQREIESPPTPNPHCDIDATRQMHSSSAAAAAAGAASSASVAAAELPTQAEYSDNDTNDLRESDIAQEAISHLSAAAAGAASSASRAAALVFSASEKPEAVPAPESELDLLKKQIQGQSQEILSQTLMRAIQEGNLLYVQAICEIDPKILQSPSCAGALIEAVSSRYTSQTIIDILIQAKAPIDLQDRSGFTALMLAAQYGLKVVAEKLIAAGANLERETEYQRQTALMLAAQRGHKEITEMLITAKADTLAEDKGGYTALDLAAQAGHKEIAEILILNGGNVNRRWGFPAQTALLKALQASRPSGFSFDPSANAKHLSRYQETIQMLIDRGADLSLRYENETTALMWAINKRLPPEILSLLIHPGTHLDIADFNGKTALMHAVAGNHKEIISMLINARADLNLKDGKGLTALMQAIEGRHGESADMLIAAQADLNVQDANGNTALMQNIAKGHTKIVQTLIDAATATALDLRNTRGCTALMLAVQYGYPTIVQALIDKGATLDLEVLGCASANGQKDLVNMLIARGFNPGIPGFKRIDSTVLIDAVQNGHKDIVTLLIDRGADLDGTDGNGCTALMHAVKTGRVDIASILIERGANLDGADGNGLTALMHAARSGRIDIASILVNRGAKLDSTDRNGWTALMHAAQHGRLDIVQALIDAKAHLDLRSAHGDTALTIAIKRILRSGIDLSDQLTLIDLLISSSPFTRKEYKEALNCANLIQGYVRQLVMELLQEGFASADESARPAAAAAGPSQQQRPAAGSSNSERPAAAGADPSQPEGYDLPPAHPTRKQAALVYFELKEMPTQTELRRLYRKAALELHPDKWEGTPRKQEMEEKYKILGHHKESLDAALNGSSKQSWDKAPSE